MDVAAARLCLTPAEPLMGIVAYHCQQAAEKLMKAALILRASAAFLWTACGRRRSRGCAVSPPRW
jgi:hypothetical protein